MASSSQSSPESAANSAESSAKPGSGVALTIGEGRTLSVSEWNLLVWECSTLAPHWRTVSTYLGLPKLLLDKIECDHSNSVERCWSEALSLWLQQNAPFEQYGLPTWSALLKAVVRVDRLLARKLAATHQCPLEEDTSETQTPADENSSLVEVTSQTPQAVDGSKPPQDACETKPSSVDEETKGQPHSKTGVNMIRSNIEEINALFTALLLAVQAALQASSNATSVRDFLITFFKQDFPTTENVKDLLHKVTLRNLWSYEHYNPLEKLTNHFLPGNEDIATLMSEYKERLSGHYMTTKLIDYIHYQKELFDSDSDTESDEDPADPSPPKLTKKLHKRIKIVLKLERKLSSLSLQYVHNLWIAFAKEYDIPSLTAILDKIATGSLEISWLVPTSFAEKIRPRSRFFRAHAIVTVYIDSELIYDENLMADKERRLLELCVNKEASAQLFSSLLEEGVDPDVVDKEGNHPLWYASWYGRSKLIELFLLYGASVDLVTQDDFGETALVVAASKGHRNIVEVLVRHSADVNYRDKKGQSVLWRAAYYGHTDIVLHLLEHGAVIDLPNDNDYGETALFSACSQGHLNTVALLLQSGAMINYQRKDGATPLYVASRYGHVEVVSLLLEKGADLNKIFTSGVTPLYAASQGGHVEVVSLLLEKGADLNKGQQPPLYVASLRGHVDVVKVLVSRGADVDKRCDDEFGGTPLMTACAENHIEIARLLIERGAKVNLQTKDQGHSSLHIASMEGHTAIVKLLLHSQAQLELRNKEGRTVLMVAAWRGHLTTVKELLRAGAHPNTQDQEGLTSLMLATQNGHGDVVNALLDAGADPNIIENNAEWSVVYFAAKTGNAKIVEDLLQRGASVDIRDKNDLTPADISDDEVIREKLRQHSIGTASPVSETHPSQEEQDDTSADVSQCDEDDLQSEEVETEDKKKEVWKDREESKGLTQQHDTHEKKQDLVKKSYQKLLRIFDVLEDSLLPGRSEKRKYQKEKETPSNIAESNQQLYHDLNA